MEIYLHPGSTRRIRHYFIPDIGYTGGADERLIFVLMPYHGQLHLNFEIQDERPGDSDVIAKEEDFYDEMNEYNRGQIFFSTFCLS